MSVEGQSIDGGLSDQDIAAAMEGIELTLQMRETGIFGVSTSPEGAQRLPGTRECEEGMLEAGARVKLAELLRAEAMVDLAAWVRTGVLLGIPKRRAATLGGISRGTVYSITDAGGQ
jgi:hypothetical protein